MKLNQTELTSVRSDIRKILQLFVSTLLVGFFLMGVISANKAIETLKGREEYEQSTYGSVIHLLKEDTGNGGERQERDDLYFALSLDIWEGIDESTGFAIIDKQSGLYMTSDEDDSLMRELVTSLAGDERKLNGDYDYFNTDCGSYNFLVRIEHESLIQLLGIKGTASELGIEVFAFMLLLVIVFVLFRHFAVYKKERIIGFIFIAFWIGFISISSAVYLNNYHNEILLKEKEHTIELIDHYYKNRLFASESDYSGEEEYASFIVDIFSKENSFIEEARLNGDYHGESDVGKYVEINFDEKDIANKRIEYLLSTLLFLVLAFILYDETSKRILDSENSDKESHLHKTDEKMVLVIMLLSAAMEMTMTLVLPRILEAYRLNFGVSDETQVAFVFSLGILFNTVFAYFANVILKKLRGTRLYFILSILTLIGGCALFALADNFLLVCLGYILISIADSLANVLMFFYIAGTVEEERREEFLLKAQKQKEIGSSVGIIIGGILASIFTYGTVLMLGAFIALMALLVVAGTKRQDYRTIEKDDNERLSLKNLFGKRRALWYLLLIAVPLAFQDVYMDYKFPSDILAMGLSTVAISFVSMAKTLVSAYALPYTIAFFKDRLSYFKTTLIFGLGGVLIMALNELGSSIFMIIVATVIFGLLDSFGELSYRESFCEITEEEEISETDSMVLIKTSDKLGETIGPNLISLSGSAYVLPFTTLLTFIIYILTAKRRKGPDSV